MCRSCSESGRRCQDHRRLRRLPLDRLRPAATPGTPDIDWAGGATPPAQLYEQHDAKVAAATISTLQRLADIEPQITGDILEAMPNTARLEGLQFRLKSPGSLAGKIARKFEMTTTKTPQEIADSLTDLVRYTGVTAKPEEVAKMTRDTIGRLTERGWTVEEAEQSYVDGNPYKGIHTILRHSDTRQTIELQFHSAASLKVKEEWHETYEVMRDENRPRQERSEAFKTMARAWATIPAPPGLASLRSLGGVPVTTKVYINNNEPKTQEHRQKGRTP